MIDVAGLVKRYGRFEAVAGIDLRARRGEVLALLGPNGAGKSTTIKTITGLVRPDAGRVLVAGVDVVRETPWGRRPGWATCPTARTCTRS